MSHSFTRKELFELVWSEPIRDIAKRLEISDVGLAKACRNADVPVPPRGFWNKQKAGHRVVKADLPQRRPGHSDKVTIGRDRRWYYSEPVDLVDLNAQEPPPPVFEEFIEAVRARVSKVVSKISIQSRFEFLHSSIKALLDKDEERREKQKSSSSYGLSLYAPHFDAPTEQRRLRILNALLLALESQGCRGSVEGDKGRDISIGVGQSWIRLGLEPIHTQRPKDLAAGSGNKARERLKLGIAEGHDRDQAKIGKILAEDAPGSPIEKQLRNVVINLIVLGEEQYREGELTRHKWKLENRARRIAETTRQKDEAERKERERLAALKRARVDRLLGEASSLHQAEQIRVYVSIVDQRLKQSPDHTASEAFFRWKAWALAQADRIDPVKSGRFLTGFEEDVVPKGASSASETSDH